MQLFVVCIFLFIHIIFFILPVIHPKYLPSYLPNYPPNYLPWLSSPGYPPPVICPQLSSPGYPLLVICPRLSSPGYSTPVILPAIWCFPIWLTSSLSYLMAIFSANEIRTFFNMNPPASYQKDTIIKMIYPAYCVYFLDKTKVECTILHISV